MTAEPQDIYTASALKGKYYDLFIKDMINRDHYIKINSKIYSAWDHGNNEGTKVYTEGITHGLPLTKKELTKQFWYWIDEQMNILTEGISNINLKHLWKEVNNE